MQEGLNMEVVHEGNVPQKEVNGRFLQWIVAGDGSLQSDHCSCCIMQLGAGQSAKPPHSHPNSEEAIYILDGVGKLLGANGQSLAVEPGSFLLVRQKEIHMLCNTGADTMKALCFYSAPTGLDDYVMHPLESVDA